MTGGASYLFPKFLSEQHLIVEISSAVCSPVILNSIFLVSQTGKTEKRKRIFTEWRKAERQNPCSRNCLVCNHNDKSFNKTQTL